MFKVKPSTFKGFLKVLLWLYVNDFVILDVILVKKSFNTEDKR